MSRLDDIWLPAGVRPEPEPLDAEAADRILGPDDTVSLTPVKFGRWEMSAEDGRESLPAVEVDCERLRQQVIDRTAVVEYHGITAGLGGADGTTIEFPDGPQLLVRADVTYLIGPIVPLAPEGFLMDCLGGFALVFEATPNGQRPYLTTGPMKALPSVVVPNVPGKREDPPLRARRNDPCPCGSGRKFKVCHG